MNVRVARPMARIVEEWCGRVVAAAGVLAILLAGTADARADGHLATTVAKPAPRSEARSRPRTAARPAPSSRGAILAARAVVKDFDLSAARVHAELRQARHRGDRARAGCLDAMLTRVHVTARSGRAMLERFEGAQAAGDAEAAKRELVRLAFLRDRVRHLVAEARQCGERKTVLMNGEGTIVRVTAPGLPPVQTVESAAPRGAPNR